MTRLIRLGVRGQAKARQVPRAPLPAPGVTSHGVASRTPSEGVTPPSKLIRTHAPDQIPLAGFGCPYSGKSLQVVVSPCWEMPLPGVISANLSPHAWTYTPAPPLVHIPVSSQETSAFTASGSARQSRHVPYSDFCTAASFAAIGHSLMFRPADLLATHIAPTAVLSLGSRGFYVRAYYGLLPPRTSDMLTV